MLRLRLLGGVELRGDEDPGGLREILAQPKRLGLLSYLAVESPGRHVRRDTLLGFFWPEFEECRGRAALRRALHFLRQRLGDGTLANRGAHEVLLSSDRLRCDVAVLERAAAEGRSEDVLERYAGELLPGFFLDGLPEFERWLERRRQRVRRVVVEAAVELAERAMADGEPQQAAGWLRQALEVEPATEDLVRRLLGCLALAGDGVAALEAYREWAERVSRNGGGRPSEATRRLVEALEEGRLEEVAAAAGSSASGSEPRRAPAVLDLRALTARELAERARELADTEPASNLAAVELAEQAVRLAPDASFPRAVRAEARSWGVHSFGRPHQELSAALADAERAVAAAAGDAEAHYAVGLAHETAGSMSTALRAFAAARALAPGDLRAVAHFGRIVQYRGDFAASQRTIGHVASRGPATPETLLQQGFNDFLLERRDEAAEAFGRALELRPVFDFVEVAWAAFDLFDGRFDGARSRLQGLVGRPGGSPLGEHWAAIAALWAGERDEALKWFERAYAEDSEARSPATHFSVRLPLGYAHLQAGDVARGRKLLSGAEAATRALLASGADHCCLHVELGMALAAQGRSGPALAALESGVRAGFRCAGIFRRDPILACLRTHSRMQELIRYIGDDLAEQRAALR